MIVNFDAQKGRYLKIDKITGQTSLSHRDGSPPKEFKPAYTGSDYLQRKLHQSHLLPANLKQPSFKITYHHKQTQPIQKKFRRNRHEKCQATHYSNHSFFDTKPSYKQSKFQKSIQQYQVLISKLNQSSCQLTHKEKQLPNLFKSQSSSLHKPEANKENRRELVLPEIFSQKSQLHREKTVFLRYNSQHVPKSSEKKESELKERKTNMKILEKEYLSVLERLTNKVYQ